MKRTTFSINLSFLCESFLPLTGETPTPKKLGFHRAFWTCSRWWAY